MCASPHPSSLIPHVCGMHQGSDKQSEVRIKKFMTMMDSMTEKELNTNDIKVLTQPSRILRISRGAGRTPQDYHELLGGSISLRKLSVEALIVTLHACTQCIRFSAPGRLLLIVASLDNDVIEDCQPSMPEHSDVVAFVF